jgi:hypothetical protein
VQGTNQNARQEKSKSGNHLDLKWVYWLTNQNLVVAAQMREKQQEDFLNILVKVLP